MTHFRKGKSDRHGSTETLSTCLLKKCFQKPKFTVAVCVSLRPALEGKKVVRRD